MQFVVTKIIYIFLGKGKGENKILKEFVWTSILKIFFQKYLVVRRTTRSQFLVVLTHFLVVEDTHTLMFPNNHRSKCLRFVLLLVLILISHYLLTEILYTRIMCTMPVITNRCGGPSGLPADQGQPPNAARRTANSGKKLLKLNTSHAVLGF